MSKTVLALAGLGTIGAGLAKLLSENPAAGKILRLKSVLVRDLGKPRSLPDGTIIGNDASKIVEDPEVDVVVEVMGGVDSAFAVVERALNAGKHVVTANKNLLAEKGPELFALARKKGVSLGFEASVCAGIPIIRTLREALRAETILSIEGIVNGTTNYILTRMSENASSYTDALREAQEKGYAEPDPSYDVSGKDAACKATILTSLAFGHFFPTDRIRTSGISNLDSQDVSQAEAMGYRIKLIASARRTKNGQIDVEVAPVLLPKEHPLASVRLEYNAVLVDSTGLGLTLYSGKGAGPSPTAVSLLADLMDVAQGRALLVENELGFLHPQEKIECDRNQLERFYIHLNVPDLPGVLAKVAGVLASQGVSLASVLQPEVKSDTEGLVPLILTTHQAQRGRLDRALEELSKEGWEKGVVLRIQDL